jgi:hypothetical protein
MSTGAGAAAAAVAIAEATKASGVLVRVAPRDFENIVALNDEPLVVHAPGGFFSSKHSYLTSFRGLAFFSKSDVPLQFGGDCLLVEAQKIWIPG